jgi:MFS family permease
MSTADAEVVRADPIFRRRFLGVLLLLAVGGVAAILALHLDLEATRKLADHDPGQALEHVLWLLEAVSTATAAALVLFGLYGLRLANRVYRAERYPLAKQKVLRDTPVEKGKQARRRALGIGVASAVLLALALLLPYAMSCFVSRLAEGTRASADRIAHSARGTSPAPAMLPPPR